MRRAELDIEQRLWRLPPERVKNNTAHSVPLSDLALTLIGEALDEAGAESELVFAGRDGKAVSPILLAGIILGSRKPTKAYPAGRCPVKDWSTHDLRRTALTAMARLGVAPIVLSHIANHRSTTRAGVTLSVYSHYDYGREKRDALERWAERLEAIICGKSASVTAITARAS